MEVAGSSVQSENNVTDLCVLRNLERVNGLCEIGNDIISVRNRHPQFRGGAETWLTLVVSDHRHVVEFLLLEVEFAQRPNSSILGIDVEFIIMSTTKLVEDKTIFTCVRIKRANLSDLLSGVEIFRNLRKVGIGEEFGFLIIYVVNRDCNVHGGILRNFTIIQGENLRRKTRWRMKKT